MWGGWGRTVFGSPPEREALGAAKKMPTPATLSPTFFSRRTTTRRRDPSRLPAVGGRRAERGARFGRTRGRRVRWLASGAPPGVEPFDAHRRDRDQHDCHHHELEVISDERNVAEVIAAQEKPADPHRSPDAVELPETDVAHAGHSRDKRREGAHDGDEPGDHDRLSAVPLVELVRPRQVLFVEQPRVFVVKDLWAEHIADPIVQGVAG